MSHTTPPDPSDPDLRPGDQAQDDTAQAAENICPSCGGSGHDADGAECSVCSGTGQVTEALGGG